MIPTRTKKFRTRSARCPTAPRRTFLLSVIIIELAKKQWRIKDFVIRASWLADFQQESGQVVQALFVSELPVLPDSQIDHPGKDQDKDAAKADAKLA